MGVNCRVRNKFYARLSTPHTFCLANSETGEVYFPSSNTPSKVVWLDAFPRSTDNYFEPWHVFLSCNFLPWYSPSMITICARWSWEHKRAVFAVVKNDDVLFPRYKSFWKSFEFSYCIYSVIDHYLQRRKFHSIIVSLQILILLSLHTAAKEIANGLLSLKHTSKTINHRWNHRLKNYFKFGIMFRVTIDFTNQMIEDCND